MPGVFGPGTRVGALGEGPHVAAGEDREVAAVGRGHVGQQVHHLHRQRPAGLGDTDGLLGLAAVGVDVAREHVGRGANDRLAHRELDVGTHQVEDQVEDRRTVDQVDERLMVRQQIAPIHEGIPVLVGKLPGVVAALQLGRGGLEARLGAHVVEKIGEEVHFGRRERAFDLKIAVDGPLLALRLGQSPCGVGQHADLPGKLPSLYRDSAAVSARAYRMAAHRSG